MKWSYSCSKLEKVYLNLFIKKIKTTFLLGTNEKINKLKLCSNINYKH